MAYDTKELEDIALKAIVTHKLVFIEDVIAYLPCNKTTFYEHKLNESNIIKDALLKVKTEMKVSMRSKWYESDNATLQVVLMKLLSSNEERQKMSQSYTDITTKGEAIQVINLGNGTNPDETTT